MKISVYDKEAELLVQTVGIQKDPKRPTNLYLFFCPYCSHQIVQVQGTVSRIMPGLEPSTAVTVINSCPRCRMRYVLTDTPQSSGLTKVILTRFLNLEPTFRCYICRTPLLSFAKDLWLLAGMKQVELPVSVTCPKANCPARYVITDVV